MWWYWDRSREPLVCQRPAPYRTIRRCNLDVVVPGPNQKRTMAFALRSTAHSGWKVQPRLCRFARCSDSIAPTPCTIATAWRARPTTACRLRTEFCWNVVVPTPKQGPVRTDLTPRDKNECLAVAQALNEQARKLSQQSRQGVPREYTRVASDLGQSCGKEDFNKAWISIEWMNGCLDNFNKDGRVGLLFKKRRLHLRNWFRVRRLFAATVRHSQ